MGVSMSRPRFENGMVGEYTVQVDGFLGLLSVEHDGNITWDELQHIKNVVWGEEIRAIEVYPAQSMLVNSKQMRHLWRLGENDFCPDLLGDDGNGDSLAARHAVAWAEARG